MATVIVLTQVQFVLWTIGIGVAGYFLGCFFCKSAWFQPKNPQKPESKA